MFKTNLPKEYYIRKLTDNVSENEQLKKRIKELESRLTSPTTNNATTIVNYVEDITKETASWQAKINAIYQDMQEAQENYFIQYSKEKLLKFRTKLKEATEETRKTFYMHGTFLNRVSTKHSHIILAN